MHATAVFDGERWGTLLYLFLLLLLFLHFMDGRGSVFLCLLVTTMMISFVA